MNTIRNAGRGRGKTVAGGKQVPPQAPAAEMEISINPVGLTDGEVRTTLVQMAQDITLQAQAMTAQSEQQDVPKKNPPSSTMASRLRDFMRMNPPVYTGSKIAANLEVECRVAMLHDNMVISSLMVHVQQVEKSRKRKHNRAGNTSRKDEKIFSRNSNIEIRDKPMFKNELSHKGESSSSKGHYDRDPEPRV